MYVVILTAYQGNSATSLLETQRWPNAERIEGLKLRESFDQYGECAKLFIFARVQKFKPSGTETLGGVLHSIS